MLCPPGPATNENVVRAPWMLCPPGPCSTRSDVLLRSAAHSGVHTYSNVHIDSAQATTIQAGCQSTLPQVSCRHKDICRARSNTRAHERPHKTSTFVHSEKGRQNDAGSFEETHSESKATCLLYSAAHERVSYPRPAHSCFCTQPRSYLRSCPQMDWGMAN